MTDDDKRLLIGIVAALEGLFTPYRTATHPSAALAAIVRRRSAYRSGAGLSWSIGGDDRNRQAGLRSLKRLQSAGLVRLVRGRTDRRCGVVLRRIDACLSLTPTKLASEVWHHLEHVAALDKRRGVSRNCGYVNERDVVGMSADSTDGALVQAFTDDAVALLIAGYLDTYCDTHGRIGWRVTDAGRQALKLGKPEPDDLGEYDSALGDAYLDLVVAELRSRETWSDDNNRVAIPLSAGLWS